MNFLIILAVALVISAVGYFKYVYFFSLGYGFSIAGIGVTMLILFKDNLNIISSLTCLLLIAYGVRLGGYLLIREIKSKAYRDFMNGEIKDKKNVNILVSASIWAVCGLLFTLQTSPVLFKFQNTTKIDNFSVVGLIIALVGFWLETAADIQKTKAKKVNTDRFCDSGLYRFVRCPNYLGELIFWVGILIYGINTLNGIWQIISAISGFILILYVMFSGARRLELRQNKNYGNNPIYKAYIKTTPILIPFVPLYSVTKYKWLVA